MKTTHIIIKPGPGITPSTIAILEAELSSTSFQRTLIGVELVNVIAVPNEGNLIRLRDYAKQVLDQITGSYDVCVDVTAEASLHKIMRDVFPQARAMQIVTGTVNTRIPVNSGPPGTEVPQVGRLQLLSVMKEHTSRGIVRAPYELDVEGQLQDALKEATSKPPRQEESGQLLTDIDTSEQLVMAVALGHWRCEHNNVVYDNTHNGRRGCTGYADGSTDLDRSSGGFVDSNNKIVYPENYYV